MTLHRQPWRIRARHARTGRTAMTRPTYLKSLIAALLATATWGGTALADDRVDNVEWFGLLGAVVTAAAVYLVANGEDADPTTSTPDVTPLHPDAA